MSRLYAKPSLVLAETVRLRTQKIPSRSAVPKASLELVLLAHRFTITFIAHMRIMMIKTICCVVSIDGMQ